MDSSEGTAYLFLSFIMLLRIKILSVSSSLFNKFYTLSVIINSNTLYPKCKVSSGRGYAVWWGVSRPMTCIMQPAINLSAKAEDRCTAHKICLIQAPRGNKNFISWSYPCKSMWVWAVHCTPNQYTINLAITRFNITLVWP